LSFARLLPFALLTGAFIAIAAGVVGVWGFSLNRQALWPVVRACVANYRLSGSPAPCLEVNLTHGEDTGFVVLRPPIGQPDTILSPTRPITGIESPLLLSPEAPNYFADAWSARDFVVGSDGQPVDPTRIGLVVNPTMVRTQDQLHIHIACLNPWAEAALRSFAARAPVGQWSELGALVPHSVFWGLPTGTTDLAQVDVFRVALEAMSAMTNDPGSVTLAVAMTSTGGREQFVILATYARAPHQWWPMGSDDLLDYSCGTGRG
jgi:CDP-diacylglycerol pyrophosphatase